VELAAAGVGGGAADLDARVELRDDASGQSRDIHLPIGADHTDGAFESRGGNDVDGDRGSGDVVLTPVAIPMAVPIAVTVAVAIPMGLLGVGDKRCDRSGRRWRRSYGRHLRCLGLTLRVIRNPQICHTGR